MNGEINEGINKYLYKSHEVFKVNCWGGIQRHAVLKLKQYLDSKGKRRNVDMVKTTC